ncbi:FAD-dependent monooxygenase [Aquabacterium sp. CECT 9606]|uniref:FAD-dependent monooxygenase n=1 Tax=Aquabacterium sp. CECT 9606 TaxID=2845822 RepID=UPI001E48623E|nr:FAD-dependent monooxygenase [Aquabacterium sp. CECT 9606]CAH0351915.1 2-octaprenyl-6-methoxyphenol hydroxylase [Aquabacterium sp. CECT 9606]
MTTIEDTAVTNPPLPRAGLSVAIIGAGPAGLALALQAAQALPQARITVFDARAADKDVSGDPRTLALSLGSVQELERMGVWPAIQACQQVAPIRAVHVSQQQPTVLWPGRDQPAVTISAAEQGVPQLGAVVSYGTLVAPMQAAWAQATGREPHRLLMRFGTPVKGLKPVPGGVEVDAEIAESFDLAVVAEGGVFADQPSLQWPQGVSRDYVQTAWVGQVLLNEDSEAGVAYERFTPSGPAALLPLTDGAVVPGGPSGRRAALVWCVQRDDDPVRDLTDAQRLVVLNTIFHERVGTIHQVSALKAFPLGLNAHRTLVNDGAVVRIGNAAQTLHPVAGQGLNLGLRDVHELLSAIKGASVAGNVDVAAALRHFQRRRQPDRWALIAGTDFLARSFTWPAPILATARGMGLGAMQLLGPLKHRLARTMMFGLR